MVKPKKSQKEKPLKVDMNPDKLLQLLAATPKVKVKREPKIKK